MPPLTPQPEDATRLRQEALAWFVRRQGGEWSVELEAAFQHWRQSDARNDEMLARCDDQWAKFDAMPQDLLAQMRHNLVHDKAEVTRAAETAQAERKSMLRAKGAREGWLPRRSFFRPMFGAAGAAAVLGLGGYVAWQQLQAQPVLMQAFSTQRGEQKEVPLVDGTRLRLDTATTVEVTYYRQRREVKLVDGQAFFSVAADSDRPFHVLAGPLRVTVLGTRFSVRHTPSLPGQDGVVVEVEEGKVRVADLDSNQQETATAMPGVVALLTAGQSVSSDPHGHLGPVSPVTTNDIAPWRGQRVSFLDTPLSQALAELERYGPTGLIVRDPSTAALRLTGTFDPMNRATLRLALPRALPVRLQENGTETEVLPAR